MAGNIKSGVKIFNVTGSLAFDAMAIYTSSVTLSAGSYTGTKSVSLGLSSEQITNYRWITTTGLDARAFSAKWTSTVYYETVTVKNDYAINVTKNSNTNITNSHYWWTGGGYVPSSYQYQLTIDIANNTASVRVFERSTGNDISWTLSKNCVITICHIPQDVVNLIV